MLTLLFFIDSQAAIKSLAGLCCNSKLVQECKLILNTLCDRCDVLLSWVPSHEGYVGNEVADKISQTWGN